MDNLFEIKLLNAGGLLLSFIGETQHRVSKKLIMFRVVSCFVLISTVTCIFINFLLVEGEDLLETLQSFSHALHTLLKYIFFIIYKPDILVVLSNIKNEFWNYQKPMHLRQSVEQIYKFVKNMQTVMVVVSFFLAWGYLLTSVFDTSHEFPLVTYAPKSVPYSAVLWLCHVYTFYIGEAIVYGYDLTYFAVCVHIVLQVRLLKERVKDILNKCDPSITGELSNCVKHHQFLFCTFLRIKRIYSKMLLVQYFLTLITSCSVLFEVLAGHSGLGNYVVKSVAVLFFFGEFAFYTLPAEQVSFEFTDLSDSIYASKWYANTVSVQKSVLLVMVKSQRIHYFSGAGFIDINVDTFGSVVRKTFSFCAIIRNLLKT